MNSLDKLYIKKTSVVFIIGILFSLLFTYLTYSNYVEALDGFPAVTYDTYKFSRMLSEYASSCFMLNLVLTAILIYNLFMYRNKKTGIFIRQLPIRSGGDFIAKSVLVLVFISALFASDILIFNALTKDFISGSYIAIAEYYDSMNIYTQTLDEIYNEYYYWIKNYYIFTIFISSALFLFSGCIGVTGFSIAMPFIVFFSFSGFLFGFSRFIRDTNMDIIISVFNISADFLLNYVFGFLIYQDKYNYEILLLFSLILYIISYFCSKFINYSKIGQLFLFKWAKVLTYFFGCIFGGFSFYYIGSGILTPDSTVILVLILFISIAISYIIISKIEKVFK